MDDEAKGNDQKEGGSDESAKSDENEGDAPSDADIMNSLHQAEVGGAGARDCLGR